MSHIISSIQNHWFPFPHETGVAPDPATDESFPEDADYENDEGDEDEYSDDYENATKADGKPKIKSSPQPKVTESTITEKTLPRNITANNTTEHPHKSETKISKPIRFPAIRSDTIPQGFKGKIEEQYQKHNLTSSKNQLTSGEKKIALKPDTYVTVTKSVSGSLDSSKTSERDDKKFESTYYTKSSTCGYFTFSCNIVYGSNGRSKICRPKTPTNGKCWTQKNTIKNKKNA